MNNPTPPSGQAQIVEFAGQLIQQNAKVHFDPEQEFILATEEKIRLCLAKYVARIENKKAWPTPLGILLAILVIFPTTTFADFVLNAATWEAIFIIAGILSFVWLIRAVWQARESVSIDDIITDLKQSSQDDV